MPIFAGDCASGHACAGLNVGAVAHTGTANLMLNATEGHLAFCPAASSALSLFDVSASIKGPAWTALGSKLDSESACQGSLVECSWGINSTILLRSQSGALCATNRSEVLQLNVGQRLQISQFGCMQRNTMIHIRFLRNWCSAAMGLFCGNGLG